VIREVFLEQGITKPFCLLIHQDAHLRIGLTQKEFLYLDTGIRPKDYGFGEHCLCLGPESDYGTAFDPTAIGAMVVNEAFAGQVCDKLTQF